MRLGFSPLTAAMLDPAAAFGLAEELGLEFVELSHDAHEVLPALQDPKRIAELKRASGLGVTVHLSYVDLNIASLIPAARRTSVERTLAGLEFAHAVEASCGVLHSGLHYVPHPQADSLVASALEESLRALEGSSVPIALENLCLTHEDFVRGPAQLHELTRRHGLRNCLDFGHAHVEGTREGRDVLREYVDLLGDGVIHLHLHDNDGSGDQHLPPGDGTVPFASFVPYLASFTGTACLEILTGEAGVRTAVARLRALLEGAR